MTFSPPNSIPFMVPENVVFSKDQQQFLLQLTEIYTKLAKASNGKDIASYENSELINGQRFFGANNQKKHQIFRKVVECGALPNTATTTIAHGISGLTANSMFTRIYGTARNPIIPIWIAIPSYQTGITVDNTNIYITTNANLAAYTYSLVILEYFKF
jgi:hypothetical protein